MRRAARVKNLSKKKWRRVEFLGAEIENIRREEV
jgi:hypothetical protein